MSKTAQEGRVMADIALNTIPQHRNRNTSTPSLSLEYIHHG